MEREQRNQNRMHSPVQSESTFNCHTALPIFWAFFFIGQIQSKHKKNTNNHQEPKDNITSNTDRIKVISFNNDHHLVISITNIKSIKKNKKKKAQKIYG